MRIEQLEDGSLLVPVAYNTDKYNADGYKVVKPDDPEYAVHKKDLDRHHQILKEIAEKRAKK